MIHVEPQVFDLLAYLIRNRERIVSKNDLIGAIWGGRAVSETALTTRLYVARNAIGAEFAKAAIRRGIRKTVAGRGCRAGCRSIKELP